MKTVKFDANFVTLRALRTLLKEETEKFEKATDPVHIEMMEEHIKGIKFQIETLKNLLLDKN